MRPSIPVPDLTGTGEPASVQTWSGLFARFLGSAYRCLWSLATPTASGTDAIVCGATLRTDGQDVVDRSVAESFPDTATNLLTEWERRLGVPTDTRLSNADRQNALLAKTSAPTSIGTAIFRIDPTMVITEPFLWSFVVTVSVATYNDAVKMGRINEIIQTGKPTYTVGTVAHV